MVKNLHNQVYFNEIIERISLLSENSQRKWGRMTVSQMLKHCDLILQIPLKRIEIPKINIFFQCIGILTKIEIQIFNNGIPHNMPTFQKVIVTFDCDFEEAKQSLLKTLEQYWDAYRSENLPEKHSLFGKMNEKDWGILEYKHLNHHLKQFNV